MKVSALSCLLWRVRWNRIGIHGSLKEVNISCIIVYVVGDCSSSWWPTDCTFSRFSEPLHVREKPYRDSLFFHLHCKRFLREHWSMICSLKIVLFSQGNVPGWHPCLLYPSFSLMFSSKTLFSDVPLCRLTLWHVSCSPCSWPCGFASTSTQARPVPSSDMW